MFTGVFGGVFIAVLIQRYRLDGLYWALGLSVAFYVLAGGFWGAATRGGVKEPTHIYGCLFFVAAIVIAALLYFSLKPNLTPPNDAVLVGAAVGAIVGLFKLKPSRPV
jgi:hypothetical protein